MKLGVGVLMFLVAGSVSFGSESPGEYPEDVGSYMEAHSKCQRSLREEASSGELHDQALQAYIQYCETLPNIDQRRLLLIEKYQSDEEIIALLSDYQSLLPPPPPIHGKPGP